MIRKTILFILIFYFLVLIQTSFLTHFEIFGWVPNIVLLTIILINLIENYENKLGIIAGFLGGFYLDVFSLSNIGFFGFYTLIFLISSFFIKFALKKHVRFSIINRA